jgi:hypothetical protein
MTSKRVRLVYFGAGRLICSITRVSTMSELNAELEHPVYNYKVVRQFAIMTVVWGIVGMLVGVST